MAVKKLPTGRWEASYRDPQRRERIRIFRTRSEGDRWFATVKTDVARGEYIDPRMTRTRFRQWADDWMATTAHLNPRPESDTRATCVSTSFPCSGTFPSGRYNRSTCDGSSPISPHPEPHLGRFATPRRSFVSCSRPPKVPGRSEEIRATVFASPPPRVGRLDLLRGRVLVAESVTDVDRMGLVFGEPKTYQRRSVTLPAFLRATDEFVFRSPNGHVLHHKTFYRRFFKPAVVAAGLPPSVRFHDLRHTCALLCIALGAHPKAIQERVGHSSITVMLDRYGHLFPKLVHAEALAVVGDGHTVGSSAVRTLDARDVDAVR
jgi:hypothetical protein